MRNAENEVIMNELRQRIADLNREWQIHDNTCKTFREQTNNSDNDTYDLIAHELLSLKMREAQFDCDNKLLSQQVMDLETQKQVLYNQIKRQDEEIQRTKMELDESRLQENHIRTKLNEMKNNIHDGVLKVISNEYLSIFE
jgi:chromosome segregation ATPase